VTFRGKEPCPDCRQPVLGSWVPAEGWHGKDRFVPDEHGCPGRVVAKVEHEGAGKELKEALLHGADVEFLQREPGAVYCRFDAIRIVRTATGHRIVFCWRGRDLLESAVQTPPLRVGDSVNITNIEGRQTLTLTN
jgi:hypothetical protein